MLAEAEPEDAELVALSRSGDARAFETLVRRHYEFIHRIAWRWCGGRAEAEDIAQEVCARLGRAIGGWRGQGAFTSWLYALTLNAARDHARRRGREERGTDAYAAEMTTAGFQVEDAEAPVAALWAAVRRLPDKQREAVTLVYGEEMTHAQAGEAMAVSEATVSWHIHEAKKRLRALMREAGED